MANKDAPLPKPAANLHDSIPLLKRLFTDNARQYTGRYALAFMFMGLVAASTGTSAWIMKDIINEIFVNRNAALVPVIAGIVVAIYAIKGGSTYAQQIILSRIGNNIVANIQSQVFNHLLKLDMNFYQRTSLGDLTVRMSTNAQAARQAINLIVTSVGRDAFSLISLILVMVFQDPFMSLSALMIMPPAVWGVSRLIKRVKKIAKAEYQSLAKIVSTIQETAQGVRVVKAFSLEGHMRKTMADAVGAVEFRANKIASIQARTSPLMETLGGIAIALVIVYGGWSVIERGRDAGAFFSFITALIMAYEPAKRLARVNLQLEQAMRGVGLLYDLLDTEPMLREAINAKPLVVADGRIAFEGVTFKYGNAPALTNLDMIMQPRSVTALVGPSGGGKTTVLGMIERFYDPLQGAVSIDGVDLREATFASLRAKIALVSQETFLFNGTIRENIAYGRAGATGEEIVEAARNANADDFITEFSAGYETQVGEGGSRLSGGQRQRIAIARAMLRNAPILLLDEATSALDAESESKIQEALDRLMRDRTTVVIAHRLSTIRNAEMIHVMDRGTVVQSGSHAKLLKKGGLYAKLHALQFRDGASSWASPGKVESAN